MTLSKFFFLLGGIWCLANLAISLVGTVVMLGCLDPSTCSDLANETARTWRPLFWWVLPLFGAGTYFGFRSTWPDIKRIWAEARQRRAAARARV